MPCYAIIFHPTIPSHSITSYPIPSCPSHPIISIPSHPIISHPTVPLYPIVSYPIQLYLCRPISSHPTHAMPCRLIPSPPTRLTSRSAVQRCGRGSAGSCLSGGRTPRCARCTGRAGRQESPSGQAGTGHTAGPQHQAGSGTARSQRRTTVTPSPPGSRHRLRHGMARVRHMGTGTDRQMGDQGAPNAQAMAQEGSSGRTGGQTDGQMDR